MLLDFGRCRSRLVVVTVCSDEELTLGTSAIHQTSQVNNIAYQPLLIKAIFSLLANADKMVFSLKLFFQCRDKQSTTTLGRLGTENSQQWLHGAQEAKRTIKAMRLKGHPNPSSQCAKNLFLSALQLLNTHWLVGCSSYLRGLGPWVILNTLL